MSDIGYFDDEITTWFQRPTVVYYPFVEFKFNGGDLIRRFHYGVGTRLIDGVEWEGFASPEQLSLVDIGEVKHPEVEVATAVEITLNGVDKAFLSQLRADIDLIYGSETTIYVRAYDEQTYQPVGNMQMVFDGYCSAPTFTASVSSGVGTRTITLTIDSIFSAKNFAPGGRINDADQQSRYSGDLGCELVGSSATETLK